jgi:hypothetical protein
MVFKLFFFRFPSLEKAGQKRSQGFALQIAQYRKKALRVLLSPPVLLGQISAPLFGQLQKKIALILFAAPPDNGAAFFQLYTQQLVI